ncbi:MAG TPA: MFS transporter [Candidatus Polarisedimenticolia bacterium]|nr:MFS transporter [Candidatus Polarisedimenticolia bacterium]
MELSARLTQLRTGFSRTFWIANTLELFERLAFYGSKAILAVYLVEKVGLGTTGNTLVGLYGFAIFFLPILAGTVVDRYGFKKSLAACFTIFSLGYFSVGLAGLSAGRRIVESVGSLPYVVGALLLTAIGGSLIKPCIVGVVARTTTETTKSLGYSIYYTLVNLGGALGPVLALQVREGLGIEYVLVMSALVSLANLLATLVFFKEPGLVGQAGPRRTFGRVLRDMFVVFGNFRFISFLIIFSGFWIMFWQIFFSLPFYVRDVLHFPRFEWFETVGPCVIITMTVPVTALMKKIRPITAMTMGFAVASASWLLVAASPTIPLTVFAIACFALGEAMQAPRFYEYVADLAPKEQVGTFMGFAFLPVAVGSLVGGWLSGWLVQHYLKEGGRRPEGMWIVLAVIGLISTLLMIAHDRFFSDRKPAKPSPPALS